MAAREMQETAAGSPGTDGLDRNEILDKIGSVIREVAHLPHTRFNELVNLRKDLKLDSDEMIDVAMGVEQAFGLAETHGELRWRTMKDIADEMCQVFEVAE